MSVHISPHVLVSQEDTLARIFESRKAAKSFLWGARAQLEKMHPGELNAVDITILAGVAYAIPRGIKEWKEIVTVTLEAYEAGWWASPSPAITRMQEAAMYFFENEAVQKAA